MAEKLAKMHTAEHLLSAVMKKHFGAPRNLEFHLGDKKTKCDYQVAAPLRDSDIARIEELVNREIANNHPVSSFVLPRDQAETYDLWKVPPSKDSIRIVKIGDFDAQPCGGQHVAATNEIGQFQIASYDTKEDGRVRIRFKLKESPA